MLLAWHRARALSSLRPRRFGIAAICETLPALLNRSGGSRGLEEAMAAAAARRGGLLAPAWNRL